MIRCDLITVWEVTPGRFVAHVIRKAKHPVLGEPNGKITQTSQLKSIDFEKGRLVTQNTTYVFRGDDAPRDAEG